MATIKRFEDLICWQKARQLTKLVYSLTKNQLFAKDYGLVNQICRAAVSVMSNIAEGFDRGTKLELINFFYIAKGSCGEVKSQLYIALDCGYIDRPKFRNAVGLSDEVSRLIQSFVDRVKEGGRIGIQYKIEKKDNKKFEKILEKAGLVQLPDGKIEKKK